MIISHRQAGYAAHCFRSDDHSGFVAHGPLSLKDLQERQEARQELSAGPISLPSDFTLDIPSDALVWLLRCGIGAEQARRNGFGYSPRSGRVILPVFLNNELIAFTARAVGNERPKYIARHKEGYNGSCFLALEPDLPDPVLGYDLVIVEDIASAARVGRLARTLSLLGTAAKPDEVWSMAGLCDNPTIAVWLDGDRAGRMGADKLARGLGLQGARVVRINTPKDPKKYSNREIREILRARLSASAADEVPQGLQSVVRDHTPGH